MEHTASSNALSTQAMQLNAGARALVAGWLRESTALPLAAVTAKHMGRKAFEPDKDSFGHALWSVLGGHEANMRHAAHFLGMEHPEQLSAYLHNHKRPSQKLIAHRHWREIFARHYPAGWAAHRQRFDEQAALLSRRSSTREPAAKESFGHALWSVLGSHEADLGHAAQLLGVRAHDLSAYLHNHKRPSQKLIACRHWREIFARHYPAGWAVHRQRFEEQVTQLWPRAGREPRRSATLTTPQP